jgi:AraC-like DNA-binding protein
MEQNKVIEKIVDYIETHLDKELSLNKIAEDLNYSKFYIARVFSEKTGITIYKYIQGRRLTIAAQKLVETDKPIIDIAYEAKYNSQQAFTLAFHQLYVCTPQIYRKNGVFYPKQSRICMRSTLLYFSSTSCMMGGRMAA